MTSGNSSGAWVRPARPSCGATWITRRPSPRRLRQDGFVQLRIGDPRSLKGRRVFVFRDRDASEQWHRFLTERVPALQAMGWRCEVDAEFGPRFAETIGEYDAQVSDAGAGRFSLELGIEIDGVRHALLPILTRLHERGGIDAAQIIGDDLITSLDDGRVLRLPAERMRRLLSVMGDLIESAAQAGDPTLVLPQGEAVAMLELEELLQTRWQDAASIAATVERFRGQAEIPEIVIPDTFKATLRPYQQHGVNWLQNLSSMGLSGFLADEMGLGKTAQTIAHLTTEHAAGRLVNPALIVVPTSLIANWSAELVKFAPASAHGGAAWPGPRPIARAIGPGACGHHHLHRAGARHRIHEDPALARRGAGRGAGDQEPRCQGHTGGLPVGYLAPAVPVRHADRKQPR